jgi:hypothetical protein
VLPAYTTGDHQSVRLRAAPASCQADGSGPAYFILAPAPAVKRGGLQPSWSCTHPSDSAIVAHIHPRCNYAIALIAIYVDAVDYRDYTDHINRRRCAMSRPRSPEYQAIGLKEAIEKVRLIWTKDYQNKVPKQVIAEHMGFKSLNGASLPIIAALSKFGLLGGRGDESFVSDLGLQIVAHEPGTPERIKAVKEAAALPELFLELDGKFPGGKASDSAIRSYLLTQKFIPSAADTAIRSYRDTKQLVEEESVGHTPAAQMPEGPTVQPLRQDYAAGSAGAHKRQAGHEPYETTYMPASGAEPFRVSFTGNGIEITAKLTTPEVADDLIRAVSALKLLLRPTETAARPEIPLVRSDISSPSHAGIPFMITHAQKEKLRNAGMSDDQIRNMTPQEAQDRLAALAD